jgi:hypothetical protein
LRYSTQHNASSRLLALPAELRNIIFQLVLGNKKIMPNSLVPADTLIIVDGRVHEGGDTPILFLPFVCKQICSETMLYMYALNTFTFLRCSYSTPTVSTSRDVWAAKRSRQQRRFVSSIMVEHSEMQVQIALDHSRAHSAVFPHLRQIVVNKAFRGFAEMQKRAQRQKITLEAWVKRREKEDVELVLEDMREELGEEWSR